MESANDAPTLAAKPGKGRLYLINGFMTAAPVPFESQTDGKPDFIWSGKLETGGDGSMVVPRGPMAAGAAAGLAIAALIKGPTPPPTVYTEFTRVRRQIGANYFYLDHKTAGVLKDDEFLAIDAVPGSYLLRYCAGAYQCAEANLDLADGEVIYILGDSHIGNGSIIEFCRQDCGNYVQQGKQVPALPRPGSNIPGF